MKIDSDTVARVRGAFEANFARGAEVGASVAVWQDGREVLCFSDGFRDAARTLPWESSTLVLVWSATKGPASACVLHALERKGLDLSARVADFWPEFAQNGKDAITVGEVLSHRAGLAGLEDATAMLLDHESVARAIEKQQPLWPLGVGHGYGPRAYGYIVDEMIRRLGFPPLGQYWREQFAEPLELDFWIGLPKVEFSRVAQTLPARSSGCADVEDEFTQAMARPGSITRMAFSSPSGALAPSSMNSPALRMAGIPSFGGIGSANALAKFYAMLAQGGEFNGKRYFSSAALDWMTTRLSQGPDQTLQTETAFAAGFMMDPLDAAGEKSRSLYGPSPNAFGHPGAGGSLAFADPESGIGFAYVMNQMELGVLPKERALALVRALYSES